jgi:hypothetical protein
VFSVIMLKLIDIIKYYFNIFLFSFAIFIELIR